MGNDAFDDLCETIEEQTKLLIERDLKIVDLKKQLAIAVGAAKWSIKKIDGNLDRQGGYIHCAIADKLEETLKQIEELSK